MSKLSGWLVGWLVRLLVRTLSPITQVDILFMYGTTHPKHCMGLDIFPNVASVPYLENFKMGIKKRTGLHQMVRQLKPVPMELLAVW